MKQFYKNKTILELSSELLKLKELVLNLPDFDFDIRYPFNTIIARKWFYEKNLELNNIPFIEFNMLNKFSYRFNGKDFIDIVDKAIMPLNPFCVPIIRQKK